MPALAQLVPGHVFARDFRVLHLLAEGGMGAVYVAEQLSTGKRRALKVMLPQLVQDGRARERFAQEARIGGHIESEHVVETVAAGIDDTSGLPWLALELLEGRDLAQTVRERGALPAAEVYEVLQQLGEGLGAAHARGIVHRDLKPENLFVAISRRRGVPFTVKILDFGIAKLTQESRATVSTTAAVGSPIWMAPEQTDQHVRIRPATDVWALGLVAFHLLTGRYYWRVANQPEVRLPALFTEVLVTPLEPASVRAAQLGVGHLVPAGFDAWLARCLDRDPERRFPDARIALASLSPGLALRDEASIVPPTHEHPARRGLAPTVPMPPSQGHPLPGPFASQPPALSAPAAYSVPQPAPHPAWGSAAQGSHASSYATPYAVHSSSTATAPLHGARGGAGRGLVIGAGLLAALLGAGVSAFGGMALWHRLARREAPPPPPLSAATLLDAGHAPASVDANVDAAGHAASAATPSASASEAHDVRLPDAGPAPAGATPASSDDASRARERARSSDAIERTTRFTWADGTPRRWRGTWAAAGWRYAITIQLRRAGRDVTGTMGWHLLATPSPEFQARIGDRADEHVEGTFDPASGALALQGQRTSDPTLVSPDRYDLRVSPAGVVSGRSHSDDGRISARPVD